MTSVRQQEWGAYIESVLGIASSVILVILMLLTVVDVISRYLFNWPLRGAFEITELMLLVLIFAGLPLVSHADEHVTMDFIDRLLPGRARDVWIRVMHAVCAAIMFFLTWQTWIKAGKIYGYGDTTDVLRIAVGPFVYFMAVMVLLTGIVHLFKVFVPGAKRSSAMVN